MLDYALSAKVKKIIYTSTFGSLLHPDDTFKDKVFTESGQSAVKHLSMIQLTARLNTDWNPQTREEVLKPGTHPWAVYTASKAVAEKEIWKFADEHKDIDVTTSACNSDRTGHCSRTDSETQSSLRLCTVPMHPIKSSTNSLARRPSCTPLFRVQRGARHPALMSFPPPLSTSKMWLEHMSLH